MSPEMPAKSALSTAITVGVISDTHGRVSPPALAALTGCDHLIHAGDIVSETVFPALSRIAPLTIVRGNMDAYEQTNTLPQTQMVEIGHRWFYVLHDLNRIDVDPTAAGIAAVIHGHTHRAEISWRDGVLYLNPGSARPSSTGKGPSVAKVRISAKKLEPQIIWLNTT